MSRGFSSVEALARAAGISTSHLYVLLEAGCDPSIDRVDALAQALACAPADLLRHNRSHRPHDLHDIGVRGVRGFPESWTLGGRGDPP